jgi:hypothetical protein
MCDKLRERVAALLQSRDTKHASRASALPHKMPQGICVSVPLAKSPGQGHCQIAQRPNLRGVAPGGVNGGRGGVEFVGKEFVGKVVRGYEEREAALLVENANIRQASAYTSTQSPKP